MLYKQITPEEENALRALNPGSIVEIEGRQMVFWRNRYDWSMEFVLQCPRSECPASEYYEIVRKGEHSFLNYRRCGSGEERTESYRERKRLLSQQRLWIEVEIK